ncbi:CHAP domain-containing protein [Myroides marinus]|uniref:CHAP domain-containing protein n=1 Tax=Myroides marinus TaxID=703342 RepID=UPI002577BD22|nr:CHAP domain-containing protein [Myroides marinus]MDM1378844.1 CHAP domain-containing protein [Myroides marinus]MDM1386115.1 CHAP domain-containing protein [Myroides marinus]MDM1393328.1 CHAP domain-containing protein [Myroides marinus]
MREQLIKQARSQLYVQEWPIKNNRGPGVKKYLNSVGLGEGYAWCMAFIYWCVQEVCNDYGVQNLLQKTGGVLAQWNGSKVLRVDKPEKGDVFIMDFGKGLGHAGIIVDVEGDVITTIEGNTNDEASREGYIVAEKKRKIKSISKGFIRVFNK